MNNSYFDKLAPWYFFLEKLIFEDQLQECRTSQTKRLTNARNVLILGDGNGRFLESFLEANKYANIESIDISKKMISLAKNRIGLILNGRKVNFINADVFKWEFPKNKYDLVVANFFLDCFTIPELKNLTEKISVSLIPKGKFIYGDFNIPNSFFKKNLFYLMLSLMYIFFRIFTRISARSLYDPSFLLIQNGFKLENEDHQLCSFLKSQLWVKTKFS